MEKNFLNVPLFYERRQILLTREDEDYIKILVNTLMDDYLPVHSLYGDENSDATIYEFAKVLTDFAKDIQDFLRSKAVFQRNVNPIPKVQLEVLNKVFWKDTKSIKFIPIEFSAGIFYL